MDELIGQPDMEKRTCTIPECTNPHAAKGYCGKHYNRWKRHGDPLEAGSRIVGDDLARFWSYVDKRGPDDCWNWMPTDLVNGYGRVSINRRGVLAHRYAWELEHGPIPEGIEIDHRCHVRTCVNPTHLRPATHKQNMENLSGARSDSQTGLRGVTWRPDGNRWQARVGHNGVRHHLGYFDTPEKAEQAAANKRAELFTHDTKTVNPHVVEPPSNVSEMAA